ncbi:MAG: serine hydrolase domain-containing protein, partial [Aristaeellaceae bacterium]
MLREVTIRNMLMMSTCYDRAMYSPLGDRDWTQPFFRGEPTHPAGTLFHYDTSASQVLCALAEKLAGGEILSFLERRLFGFLGMNGPKRWLKDGAGVSQGGTGLLMTLRDFSRLADFCMSDGQGLVPQDYLRDATSRLIATDERAAPEERYGYGYQFWRMRRGFSMYGMGGQMALCLPEEGLSLCTTGNTMLSGVGVQPIYDGFFRHLAGIGSLPSDPGDARELSARLAALALPPVAPADRQEVIRRIRFARTELPFTALTIRPEAVVFAMASGDAALPYGVGGWADGVFPGTGERCVASGAWTEKDRFVLRCEVKDSFICSMEMIVSFRGDRGAVRVSGALWELTPGWNGLAWGAADACAPGPDGL